MYHTDASSTSRFIAAARVFGRTYTRILILLAVYVLYPVMGDGGGILCFDPSSRNYVHLLYLAVFLRTYYMHVPFNARRSRCRYEQNDDGNQRQRSQGTRRQRTHSRHNHILRFAIDNFGRPGKCTYITLHTYMY